MVSPDTQLHDYASLNADDDALRRVFDHAPVAMAVVRRDGTISSANSSLAKLVRRDLNTPDRAFASLLHPEDATNTGLHLARLFSGDSRAISIESRILRPDNSELWVLVSAAAMLPVLIVQMQDITRQKNAELLLAEGDGRLSYALDAARQGVWDLNLQTGGSYYSPMWRSIRGIDKDERVDSNVSQWLSRVHPDDRERMRRHSIQQNTGKFDYNVMEYRERHRDGHYIWILSRGKPIEWMADGSVARVLGTDTDISSLKEVELALQDEKERLRITLQSIGDGVISTDADGSIVFMNAVAERMTGWKASVASGLPLSAVFSVIAVDEQDEAFAFNGDNDGARAVHARLIARHGITHEIRYTSSPVMARDEQVSGSVIVFQDYRHTREMQRKLAYAASHDPLTKMHNRGAFEKAYQSALDSALQQKRQHSLCLVDLDRFKSVNDTAGHAAGDALLVMVADTILRLTRANDFAARIGGDEFVLILADCLTSDAQMVAQKLVEAIASLDFVWNDEHFAIGASVGIAAMNALSALSGRNGPVEMADLACYEAKKAGRGQVRLSA